MKNMMRMMMTGFVTLGLGLGLTGCSDEASVKSETTVKAPDGSQTKTTTIDKVEKSGSNPPPAAH